MQIQDMAASCLPEVHGLLATNGWAHRIGDIQDLGRLIYASQRAVVAVKGGQVIGFARAITDGLSNGYLSMLVVSEGHRRQGVGQALVEHLVGADSHITWVLRAEREGAAQFFTKLGFKASTSAMERPRR